MAVKDKQINIFDKLAKSKGGDTMKSVAGEIKKQMQDTMVDKISRQYENDNTEITIGDIIKVDANNKPTKSKIKKVQLVEDLTVLDKMIPEDILQIESFNQLYLNIRKYASDDVVMSISQSHGSIDPDEKSLFIEGVKDRPNLVIIPIANNKVRVQAFYAPYYIYDEDYPSIEYGLNVGIQEMILAFLKNGNGQGLTLEDDKLII